MKNSNYAVVHKKVSGYTVLFSRLLDRPAKKVWEALTSPERLNLWLAQANMKLETGGRVDLRYKYTGYCVQGKITRLEPEVLLVYTWTSIGEPESIVTWELRAGENDTCMLSLTHSFQHECELPNILAGWHQHLDMLQTTLTNDSAEWSWPRWEQLRETYSKN